MSKCTISACPDEERVSSERMAEHEGLVHWVVRQQWLGGLSFDDALHEGRIGLWHALRLYDPSRGTAFSTYAVIAIARTVWQAVATHQRFSLPHQLPVPPSDRDDLTELAYQSQIRTTLRELVDQLPSPFRQIIVAYYSLDGSPPQTFAAIGKTMGVSRQRIHVLHKTAILWLAHPAHSLPLRLLLERHRRVDYQKARGNQRKGTSPSRHPSQKDGSGCRPGALWARYPGAAGP